MRQNYSILPAIFIASLCSLSYEITLIRIFSISLWYHFAFMVISIAMLGIAASGTLLSIYPGLKDDKYLGYYFLIFSVGIPASYLLMNVIPFDPARLSWDKMQLCYISLYYILLSFPFFSFGLIISTSLSVMNKYAGHIYGADLTGAGTGSLLVLWLLSAGGPEKVVFIISSIAALSVFICGGKKLRTASFMLLIINAGIIYFHPTLINPKISPYKPLETALRFPGAEHLGTYYNPFSRVDIFKSPAVRFAPGLSLRYLNELPQQVGITIDAGDIYAVTKDTDKKTLDFLRYLPSSLPYELSRQNSVLIVEPRGGLPVLTAGYYGSEDIYTVDSNPLVIEAVRGYPKGFTTGIYNKNAYSGLGRSWLASSLGKFDLIDISMTGSMPSGSFGFSEDYRFTVEAFGEYLRHLNPEGLLAINLFIIPPPRAELRLLNTIAAAIEKQGVRDSGRHLIAVRSWDTITLILKKSGFSKGDLDVLKGFARDKRFDMIYYPGITEKEANIHIKMPSSEYFEAFQNIISEKTRAQFNKDYIFDISPVYDEKPFSHYYLKLKNFKKIYKSVGSKWQYFIEEGYLLPVIFIQVLFLSAILILLPSIKLRSKIPLDFSLILSLAYFAFLGIGYMFIEISFIQKMILPLENPSYAAAAVLSSMLISSGLGSLLSQHLKTFQNKRILLFLCLTIFLYGLFLPSIMEALHPYSLRLKIISVFFTLLPAGLLLGIPFPLGLLPLGRNNPELIPWAWAVNGCLSVLAPILSVMLAISAGFKAVILSGMIMYLLAFLCLRRGSVS